MKIKLRLFRGSGHNHDHVANGRRQNHCGKLCRQFSRTGKASTDGVIHPNVFVQFLPAQGQTVQAKRGFFEKILRRVGEQWIFRGGKTDKSSINEFQTNPPGFNPAAHGCGFGHIFSDHAIEFNKPHRGFQCTQGEWLLVRHVLQIERQCGGHNRRCKPMSRQACPSACGF